MSTAVAADGVASWDFAVLALSCDGAFKYFGAVWGLVAVSSPDSSATNDAAEVAAVCWAVLVALRFLGGGPGRCLLRQLPDIRRLDSR